MPLSSETPPVLFAVLADLVNSRAVADRAGQQRRLIAELERLNETYADDLAAPLAMTAGDEFEGLFVTSAHLVTIVQSLSDVVAPERLTFGLGAGDLTTPLTGPVAERRVGRLDGSVFHAARAALRAARRQDAWLAADGFGQATDVAVTGIGELLGELRQGWTERRAQIVRLARGRRQKDVAEELALSKSVISEALKAARYDVVLRNEGRLQALLDLREAELADQARAVAARESS